MVLASVTAVKIYFASSSRRHTTETAAAQENAKKPGKPARAAGEVNFNGGDGRKNHENKQARPKPAQEGGYLAERVHGAVLAGTIRLKSFRMLNSARRPSAVP